MEPEMLEMFRQQVTVEPYAGRDFNGLESYGDARVVKCRVEGKVRMVRSVDGNEAVSSSTIIIPATVDLPVITPRDRITLPTSLAPPPMPTQPKILAVVVMPDIDGTPYYSEVFTP